MAYIVTMSIIMMDNLFYWNGDEWVIDKNKAKIYNSREDIDILEGMVGGEYRDIRETD